MFATDIRVVARHDPFMVRRKARYPDVFLREWRDYLGISQDELGAKLNANKWFIYRIERLSQPVDNELRRSLGVAMGIDGERLLERPPEKDSLTNVSQSGPAQTRPMIAKEAAVPTELRLLMKRLKQKFGKEAVLDAYMDEDEDDERGRADPLQRRRT